MKAPAAREPRAWPPRKWWSFVAAVLLVQVALILIFGARNVPPVRAATQSEFIRLAGPSDPLIALRDPTLFALPHTNDFSAAKRGRQRDFSAPQFHWTEPPRWLGLARGDLLNSYDRFMQTNPPAAEPLNFKPEPIFSSPPPPPAPQPPTRSTFRLRGEIAQRRLLNAAELERSLPNWPETELLAPTRIQVLVNAAGQVVSAVLLQPDSGLFGGEPKTRDENADRRALKLAKSARFAPGPQMSVGQVIFDWHTVPAQQGGTNIPTTLP